MYFNAYRWTPCFIYIDVYTECNIVKLAQINPPYITDIISSLGKPS